MNVTLIHASLAVVASVALTTSVIAVNAYPKALSTNLLSSARAQPRSAEAPTIANAHFEAKRLIVAGADFEAGAVILINGIVQKTKNDADNPSQILIAKKGRKSIGRNEVVLLQVINPIDIASDPFPFFGGPTITLLDNGRDINLSIGEQFLVALGGNYDWTVDASGLSNIVGVPTLIGIPGSQGIFEPVSAGKSQLSARGEPRCPKGTCADRPITFEVTILVR